MMKKKIFTGFIILLMTFSIVQGLAQKGSNNSTDELVFDFYFSEPTIKQIESGNEILNKISLENLKNTNDYNKPCLPVKTLKILLPYGQEVDNINILKSEKIFLKNEYKIEAAGKLIPVTKNEFIDQNVKINLADNRKINYNSEEEHLFSNIGTYICKGYKILHINLYPVQYNELNNELYYYNSLKVTINTIEAKSTGVCRGLQIDKEFIKQIVDNPQIIDTYDSNLVYSQKTTGDYEYIIITSEKFKNAQGDYTFQDIIDSKIERGITAGIFTIEEIKSNQDYSVNGIWGDNNPSNPFYKDEPIENIGRFNDLPAKIRNFIRMAYTEWGTSYVLLGGDADEIVEEDNILPLRGLYADEEGLPLNGLLEYESDDIPSDVYYACLDGNFNYDNDDHFGECAEFNDDSHSDEADLMAEVWVGRACVDSIDEISNFVMKTLKYENQEINEDTYLKEILFLGEYLGFPGECAYGGNYKDYVESNIEIPDTFTITKIYDREERWDAYFIIDHLSQNNYHLINHDGHGNEYYMLKASGDGIACLTNDEPFFIYSHSCLTGSFDNWDCYRGYMENDCVAEILTCEIPYGAFACILNARYGLGSENSLESPSGALDEAFYTALFSNNMKELGKANHYSKEYQINRIDENGIRWCYYETNLFGDPELRIKDPVEKPEIPEKPTGPQNGKIDEDYSYTTKSTDPNGDNLYYMWDWGDGTDSEWVGPFNSGETCEQSHTWTTQGNYEIKVKVKDSNDYESDWSESLSVSVPKNRLQYPLFYILDQLLNRIFNI